MALQFFVLVRGVTAQRVMSSGFRDQIIVYLWWELDLAAEPSRLA